MPRVKNADPKQVTGSVAPPLATNADKAAKPKKKRRLKRVKSEIRRFQTGKRATDTLNSKSSMARVIREIVNDINPDMRMQPSAIAALHHAAEAAAVELLVQADHIARVNGGRAGPLLKDLKTARGFMPHLLA